MKEQIGQKAISRLSKNVLLSDDKKTPMSRFDWSVRASSCEQMAEKVGRTVEKHVL